MRQLTDTEYAKVEGRRKVPRPSCYDPESSTPVTIGPDFEAFLILASDDTKQKASAWAKELLNQEADAEYEALLTETAKAEDDSSSRRLEFLSEKVAAYNDWRAGADVRGFEDVAEIGWLFSEFQSGYKPFAEADRYTHELRLLRSAKERLSLTKDAQAARKDRVNAWVSVLSSY
jgi:hypothetical protein